MAVIAAGGLNGPRLILECSGEALGEGAAMADAGEVYSGVMVDPNVMHGTPVLTGTRIPVSLALGQFASGATYEDMQREYGLTPDQLCAAFGYAAQLGASESVSAVPSE